MGSIVAAGQLESLFRKMGVAGYIETNMFLFFSGRSNADYHITNGKDFLTHNKRP